MVWDFRCLRNLGVEGAWAGPAQQGIEGRGVGAPCISGNHIDHIILMHFSLTWSGRSGMTSRSVRGAAPRSPSQHPLTWLVHPAPQSTDGTWNEVGPGSVKESNPAREIAISGAEL